LEFIETVQQPKRNFISTLLVLVNRPMLALSVLIHVGLLSIPLPEKPAAEPEETPEDVSGITDLSQVSLAASPLVEQTPLPLPSVPLAVPTVEPTVEIDFSRAPRPPKKATPTPAAIVSKPPVATPTPTPTPTPAPPSEATAETAQQPILQTPAEAPPAATLPPSTPTPAVNTPPPPPAAIGGEDTTGLSVEALQSLFEQFRRTLPESGTGQVYPTQLAQPNAFFKPQVVALPVATEEDCLDLMIYCWWQPAKNPNIVKRTLEEGELFANIAFEEVSGGYGGGQLYRLITKSTGTPTSFYLTLVRPRGATGTGTMVGFWLTDPSALP